MGRSNSCATAGGAARVTTLPAQSAVVLQAAISGRLLPGPAIQDGRLQQRAAGSRVRLIGSAGHHAAPVRGGTAS